MHKLFASIKKDFLVLWNDKIGLALLFIMPIILVFVITIVQDSAYKVVNENRISLLLVNADQDSLSNQFVHNLSTSDFFSVEVNNTLSEDTINKVLIDEGYVLALYIPSDFSKKLRLKTDLVSNYMLKELGLSENQIQDSIENVHLKLFHDPVLQENYSSSIANIVAAFAKSLEGELLINEIGEQVGFKNSAEDLTEAMVNNRVEIDRIAASLSDRDILPNSTQHNVPAWTIFAMFFMVVSLGGKMVRERINGSFIRLKTMPTSFSVILASKLTVYLLVSVLQVILIFSLAKIIFPAIDLPPLIFPDNWLGFSAIVLISGLTAVSYAMVVGTIAKTQEQANGFGAVSIVILASIGGIWVPHFILPDFLQNLSNISPLYWCLKGFYTLFLLNGNWSVLLPIIGGLSAFILCCWIITYYKLKADKIL
tara:strand:- start:85 stop:1359 length:1275 start_codon:yes stop_codon:yes gene_type:complete